MELEFDAEANEFFGYDRDNAGYYVKHILHYAPSSKSFTFDPISYVAPPPACVSAFSNLVRYDNPDIVQSFNTNSALRTLQTCRRDDWIMEAKKRRSEYSTFSDAAYFDGHVVLLHEESARQIVDTLCNYTNSSGYYIFRRINPVSIACED